MKTALGPIYCHGLKQTYCTISLHWRHALGSLVDTLDVGWTLHAHGEPERMLT